MISRQGDRVNIQRLCSRVRKDCKTAKVMCKSLLSSNVFESIKGLWITIEITIEAGHCKQSGEATGEGTARIVSEAPELMGLCRDIEAWHHRENPGVANDESAPPPPSFNTRLQHFRDISPPWVECQVQQQPLSEAKKTTCVCIVEGEPEKLSRPFGGAPEILNGSYMLDTKSFIHLEFDFALFRL